MPLRLQPGGRGVGAGRWVGRCERMQYVQRRAVVQYTIGADTGGEQDGEWSRC